MSKLGILGTSVVIMLVAGGAIADKSPGPADPMGTHVMLTPNDLKWGDSPPGLPKGAKAVVLEGDPSKPGPFTIRPEFPAGYKIKPHFHPAIEHGITSVVMGNCGFTLEHVTVISGDLYMGMGDSYDEAKGTRLPPAGFAVMPTKFVHYAFTKEKKAVIQLHGIGPWGITYVNPSDDPRGAPPPK